MGSEELVTWRKVEEDEV